MLRIIVRGLKKRCAECNGIGKDGGVERRGVQTGLTIAAGDAPIDIVRMREQRQLTQDQGREHGQNDE